MDGRVLHECFDERFVNTHPVTYGKGDDRSHYQQKPRDYSDEEAEKVKKRLRGLGYMS